MVVTVHAGFKSHLVGELQHFCMSCGNDIARGIEGTEYAPQERQWWCRYVEAFWIYPPLDSRIASDEIGESRAVCVKFSRDVFCPNGMAKFERCLTGNIDVDFKMKEAFGDNCFDLRKRVSLIE